MGADSVVQLLSLACSSGRSMPGHKKIKSNNLFIQEGIKSDARSVPFSPWEGLVNNNKMLMVKHKAKEVSAVLCN